jgi:hypothetical protein
VTLGVCGIEGAALLAERPIPGLIGAEPGNGDPPVAGMAAPAPGGDVVMPAWGLVVLGIVFTVAAPTA